MPNYIVHVKREAVEYSYMRVRADSREEAIKIAESKNPAHEDWHGWNVDVDYDSTEYEVEEDEWQ